MSFQYARYLLSAVIVAVLAGALHGCPPLENPIANPSGSDGSNVASPAGDDVEATPLAVTIDSNLSTAAVGDTVSFRASAAGGDPPYRWHWTDDADVAVFTNTAEPHTDVTFTAAGECSLRATVTDASGGSAVATWTVTVQGDESRHSQSAHLTVAAAGGAAEVDQPGTPLHGLRIDVPAGAYPDARLFEISTHPVTREYITAPLTPIIEITDGAGNASEPVLVRIPIAASPSGGGTAFFVDVQTEKLLNVIPTVAHDDASLTVAAPHFSKIIVLAWYDEDEFHGTVTTQFTLAQDFWLIRNTGTYATSGGGICRGLVATALWYWEYRRDHDGRASGTMHA